MRRFRILAIAAALVGLGAGAATAQTGQARRLSRTELENKIRGGWAGQMIGVSYGAPTEFVSNRRIIRWPITWKPENVTNSIKQDDLYVEMTFAEVLDKQGLDATTEQFGEMFKNSKYMLWHANASARRLLNRGVKAPWSGHPKFNAHADDIDFQIESDFIGLMTPGLPQVANSFADRVGRVMNYGDGLYGGMFFSGMYSAAFFETDPRKVVEAGLASIPADSKYGKVIRDVLDWSATEPDWRKTWRKITDKWDRDDACPDGALNDFNIDAKLNGAFVALGLLYGGGDFSKTLEVATRSGQDSDCNPSSAAGILGVMIGYNAIPDEWKSGIPAIADTKFDYTNYTFNEIIASTVARALKVVEGAGGQVSSAEITVPFQAPKSPALEQWDVDAPTASLLSYGGAWTWSDGWEERPAGMGRAKWTTRPDAQATLQFSGTGVVIRGEYDDQGGKADVILDGQPAGTIDASDVFNVDDSYYWFITGLKPGPHTVQVRMQSANGKASGALGIEGAIVYGK
jgi:ADP-ribosylglycohydrolase